MKADVMNPRADVMDPYKTTCALFTCAVISVSGQEKSAILDTKSSLFLFNDAS